MYIGQWCLSPLQSRHLGTSDSSPSRHQLPCCIFLISHQWCEIFSLSRVILLWGNTRSCRAPNLGCRGAESPGWFDVTTKNCTKCDPWGNTLSWWSCQSPVVHHCGLLNHLKSFYRRMFNLNSKFDADSLLYKLSHFECDDHIVLMAHSVDLLPPLTHFSHMCSPVHCPWLPGYINVVQTILLILTKVGHFLNRPHISKWFLFFFCYHKPERIFFL